MKYRLGLIILLGGKCQSCAFTDIRALQLDHVKGGGKKEIKKRGNIAMYYYYHDHPEEAKTKLQVLCGNCNWIKRHENKEFPRSGRPRTVGLINGSNTSIPSTLS